MIQNYYLHRLFAILLFTFSSQVGFSQGLPDFSLTVTVTESTCLQNGALEFTVMDTVPDATITFTVTRLSDNMIIAFNITQNTIEGLIASDYEVVATQSKDGESNMQTVEATVEDSYVELDFDWVVSNENCEMDGMIEIVVNAGVFKSVEIVSGPVTLPQQMNTILSGLIAGDYILNVLDTCDILFVVSVTLDFANPVFTYIGPFFSGVSYNYDCTQTSIRQGIQLVDPNGEFALPITYTFTISPPPALALPDTVVTYVSNSYSNPIINEFIIPYYGNSAPYLVDIEVEDACGNMTFIEDFVWNESVRFSAIPDVVSCGMSFDLSVAEHRYPLNVDFISSPPGFDPLDFNVNHPGPFNTNRFTYSNDTMGAPEGEYVIQVTDQCGSTEMTVNLVAPVFGCWNNTTTAGTDCIEGLGNARVTFLDPLESATLISAPSAYGTTPQDAFPLIWPEFANNIWLTSVPPGVYEFEGVDSCGNTVICSQEVTGYVDTSFTYEVIQSCSKFDLFIDHKTNFFQTDNIYGPSSKFQSYFLQIYDTISMVWKYSDGNTYIPGAFPNVVSPLVNGGTNFNYFDEGSYRIIKLVNIPTNTFESYLCEEVMVEFDFFDNGLEFSALYSFQCDDGTYSVIAEATGVNPLTYRITEKDGSPFMVDNSNNPVFENLSDGLYTFEVEDPCGNIKIRELEIVNTAAPAIQPFNLCDGEDGMLIIDNLEFLDYQWWNNADPTTILSDTNFLEFIPFDDVGNVGTYSVNISFNGTTTCIDTTLEFVIPAGSGTANAGEDYTSSICRSNQPINLFDLLGASYDSNGNWVEISNSGQLSDSLWDNSMVPFGIYEFNYIVTDICQDPDTAFVSLSILDDPFNLEVVAEASTCLQNGILYFDAKCFDAGAVVTYTITRLSDGVILALNIDQNTLAGLLPGDYEVAATQTMGGMSSTIISIATVDGLFASLEYMLDVTDEQCGNDGEIFIDVTSGVFECVEVVSGPIILPPQDSMRIVNLVSGSYQLKIKDACGNEDLIDVEIDFLSSEYTISFKSVSLYNDLPCDSIRLVYALNRVGLSELAYPIYTQIVIHPPATTGLGDVIIYDTITTGGPTGAAKVLEIPFYGNGNLYSYDIHVIDNCGNPEESLANIINENLDLYGESFKYNCGMYFEIHFQDAHNPVNINFISSPAGFDPLDFNPNHPGPFDSSFELYIDSVGSAPEGIYEIEITDNCDTYTETFDFIKPVLESFNPNPISGLGTDCQPGFGVVRLVWNSLVDTLLIIDAPASYSETLPHDVSDYLGTYFSDINSEASFNGLPEGSYTFEGRDTCGEIGQITYDVPGYVDSSFVFEVIPSCGKFDVFIDHKHNHFSNNSTIGGNQPRYYIQKFDEGTNEWKFFNGQIFNGSFPSNTATQLINQDTTYNFFEFGNFRILRLVGIPNNSNSGLPRTKVCDTVLAEFTFFDDGLLFENLSSIECTDETFTVFASATGVEPLNYSIISIDGISQTIDNGIDPIFIDLSPGIYSFEVADPCGNTQTREIELTDPSPFSIQPVNLCDGEDGMLIINNLEFLDYQWWNNDDPTTILSDTNFLEFIPFDDVTDAGTYSVNINFTGTSTCVDTTLEFVIPEGAQNPNAGDDHDSDICRTTIPVDLFDLIGSNYNDEGEWIEITSSGQLNGSIWDNSSVPFGDYEFNYIVNDICEGPDTAFVTLTIIDSAFDVEVIAESSTCLQNGILNFDAICFDAGAVVTYTIKRLSDGVVLALNIDQNTLAGLLPGDYEMMATQTLGGQSSSITEVVTVNNAFVDLNFSIEIEEEICGSDGEIQIIINSGVFSSVSIVSGPITSGPQDSTTIVDLVAGEYVIEIVDSCGNIDVVNVEILNTPANIVSANKNVSSSIDLPCDQRRIHHTISSGFPEVLSYPLSVDIIVHPPISLGLPDTLLNVIIPGDFPPNVTQFLRTWGFITEIPYYGNNLTYTYDLQITDGCGTFYDMGVFTEFLSFNFDVIAKSNNCNLSAQFSIGQEHHPLYVQFDSFPAGFDPLDFNMNHPGPFYADPIYENDTLSMPEGNYNIRLIDACDTLVNTIYLERPVLEHAHTTVGTDCEIGFGDARVVFNNQIDSAFIITAPASYTDPLPSDISSSIDNFIFILKSDLPEGTYTFMARDTCGDEATSTVFVPGYSETSFNYEITPSCSKFDIFLEHLTNFSAPGVYGSVIQYYYLQKLDTITEQWKYLDGTVYVPGTVYSGINLFLNNQDTTFNIFETGTFRIARYSLTLQNGGGQELCEGILDTFTYVDGGLDFESLDVVECGDGNFSVIANASGVAPFTYRIVSIDNVTTLIDNGNDPLFNDLPPALYMFEVEDACGNIKNRELELTQAFAPIILPDNLCDGEDGKLYVEGYDFLDFQWYNNNDPTTILSDTSFLEFSLFDESLDAGTYGVNISFAGNSACLDTSIQFIIPLGAQMPNAGMDSLVIICNDGTSIDLHDFVEVGAETYGVFEDLANTGNLVGSILDTDGLPDGIYPFEYQVVGLCTGADTSVITIDIAQNNLAISFAVPADICIDIGVQNGQGGATPTGGVYNGPGVTDEGDGLTYSFDPAAAGAGVHTLTYIYTDSNYCIDSVADDVEVFASVIVAYTAPMDVCVNEATMTGLSGGTPTGGVYSGAGVTDNGNGITYSFDPAAAGVGVHTITYDYTDSNGCSNSASDDVEVFALPEITFTALADLCIDAGIQTGLGSGTPTGGVYSGAGVTDDANGMTYSFDPAVVGVGVHTITYAYTDSNGCSNSASDVVVVFALPAVTFTALADLCIEAGVQTGLGSGTLTGGVYSGAGVTDDANGMTYSFDPAVAGVGVHTITYVYTDSIGCSNLATDEIEVFALPEVAFIALADLCIDAGIQVAQGGGTPTGGFYSGPGVTDNGNGTDYDFDPAAAGVGIHTITYSYTDGNGCINLASNDVEVFSLPEITFIALADLCIDATVQTGLGNGTPTGGVYSGAGVTDDANGMTYSFDPAVAGVGVHTITYVYTDSNGCSNSASDGVEIFALPEVAFTALAYLCIDACVQAAQGGGSPTGGVYSGDGVTDNGNGTDYDFDPMAAGAGVHTITYTYTDGNGCVNSASDDVEVFDLPVVAFTAPMDVCVEAGVQAGLGGGTPTGGFYSGPGVTDNGNGLDYDFDLATAGVGVHTITYDYTDANGCSNLASDDVEVFDLPTVTFTALGDLCIDAGVQAAQGGGSPMGGTYSGPGVTDNGNGLDYDFDPMAAGVGVHTITYDYTDANGCSNSASDDVEVFDLPVVTFTALADLCIDAGVQAAQGGGSPTGGVYSGTGVTDNGNGLDYDFDPMAAGAGVHTITYTYTDGNGCVSSASDDVEVFDLPVVAFTAPMDVCVDAGVQAGLGGGTPTGGVYSGPGVTDNGNGLDYDFDPATAGVGVHTITYDYTDANGCSNSASDDVEVFDLPTVDFTALDDLCIDAGVQTMQGMGVPPGGVYSGPGVTDNGNGMDYDFDPAAAGVDVHTITYTYNDSNGCTGSWSDDVEVFDLPLVTFTALADLCIDAGVQAAQGGGSPTGGVYSGDGVTDKGNGLDYDFDPMVAGAGVHTITYTYTDANGCVNSASDDVEVFDLPVVAFTAPMDVCVDAGVQAGLGGGTPTGGVYSGPGVTDNGNGLDYDFDPAAAGVGVHTIKYDYTDANGCSNLASDDVEVFDLPEVSLSTAMGYCESAPIQNIALIGGSPSGGVYSGIGVTDLGDGVSYYFDPTINGAGVVTVTYSYTDINGCSNSAMSDIEIYDCEFDVVDPCSCLDNATPYDCNDDTGGDDGQFSELVAITGGGSPLPSGQTWTVVASTSAIDAFNVPPFGTQSAGVPIAVDGSVLLAFNNGVYELPFVHIDDIGYTLSVQGPFAMGSPANVNLIISNKCQYPDPVFDPMIPSPINTNDPIIILGAVDTNGGGVDLVTYTIDGVAETELDPSHYMMGSHTLVMTYNGAEDGNGGISPVGGITAASPGCTQIIEKEFEIIECELIVDCSNIVDETLACRADLPPVDFDLPMVTDSCGDVIRSALTIIPGNSGCPGDTVFITRTYFLQDAMGNMAECMQTFTVISTMDPSFTFFPADTTVLCGADTSPASTGMATGTQECPTFNGMTATVTSNDVITPGACPQESTITRTWTVTDECGRSVDMDQVIMVVDTLAPTMVCQDITIELDANGMATASADNVDNGSSDSCGGTVALSLNMDMFTCANLGANNVWLIGEDECGNIDSCMAVVTVEDNIAPTITCPGDIVMDNDPGVCGTVVTFDVMGDDNCDFTITQTAGIPSGGLYPVGETMNTYMIEDAAGLTAECSFLVTVNDVEGPVVDCPSDIGVQLEAGECEEIVFYDIPFMDNCGTIDGEMSQAVNEALVSTALDCQNNTSNHLRYFENNLPVPVEITQVNFGIFNSGAAETVTINVYTISPSATFEYANMNLAGTTDYAVPAGMNNVILTAMLETSIPDGMNYVLELRANNTTNFVIGYNTSGETESTYISGNNPVPCVSLEPVDIDVLGFPTFAVILYSNAEGGPSIEQTGGLPSGSYFPLGTTTNTFVVTDVYGNTTDCEFDVNVFEFENGVTGTMVCNNNINVSLDMNCEVVLGADMLLEGDIYGCYDDYIISVSGGVAGNVITEPGTYTVTITDPDTGNSCWSTINVEDKREPIFEDCACPVGGVEVETPFVGTLDNNDPIWTRPFVNGAGVCNPSGAGVDIPYDTYEFGLDMDATLGAEVVTFTAPSGDSFLALYENSFDPTDPCGNLVITNDDGGAGLLSQFTVMLETGINYILVVTTFNNNGNDYGDYVVELTSEARLLELQEECNFRCVDIEYIMGSDDLTPNPSVIACSEYETYFTDELTVDANGNQIILRTWLATNANGSANCVQQFNIAPIAIGELTLPISPVILSCNDGTSPEEIVAIFDNPLTMDNPNTSFVENNEGYVYAYPTYLINGHPQKVDNQVCDVYAAYTDQELDACEEGCNGNRKVIRTWTLVDWTTLEVSTYIQTIKAVDTEAPTLITQDVTVSTDAWGCEASFEAPLPWELHDNCDSYPEYYISGPAGVSITGSFEEGYFISGAPKGTHTFNYIAYDCCGNEASYPFTVTVIDSTPPVVVAKQNVVISVTSGSTSGAGLAKLYTESIDNGSYDGCSENVKLEVRREEDVCDIRGNATFNADGHPQDGSPNPNSPSYDPDGGAYVKFCCADLDNATVDVNGDGTLDAGYVKVWLRVWDDGDMDGIFGTAGDNYNEASAFVKVENKLAPAITCPPDVTLTCDMDYTDLNMTGSASAYGSCGSVGVEYNDIIINLNTCNEGFVRRRWNVIGRSDIFCDQTITMDELDLPVNVSFSQVGDFTAANCPDMVSLGEPTWVAGPCDVMGYTVETDTFFFEDGTCYKLVNHYTVINWCDYDPNSPFWEGEGLWEHVQVIKVTDETQPVIQDCTDQMFAINDHSDSDDDGEVCEAKITLTNVATDAGSANCPTGWLKWQVIVDLWGDGTPDLEYSSFLSPFDSQFNDTNGNGIPDVYVSPTANGGTVSIPLPDIAGSMSNHKVTWKVTDGCNNVTTCDNEFIVVDKKAPTPYCVDLSTAVMESSGTVELWAIDFNVGSFDNCTAQEDLRYTFSTTPPEYDPSYDPAQHSSSMTFDCDDVANSPVQVNMYVWDEKGNADFCIVYLTLVDNTGACGSKPDIAGVVETEGGMGVQAVEVTLNAALPEYPRTEMTDENGEYVFLENALNASYQLSGSKDIDYMNGVSTLDLVKIQRHILGLEDLNSPYKLIAADVNGDFKVKASDLTELRKLILGIIVDLPTNESWRFVDAEQPMDMDMDLADMEYALEIANLQSSSMDNNLIAIKIGDVTENAIANLNSNVIEVRSNKTLNLVIMDQVVEAGDVVSVAITSENFVDVFGYQFTMELNGLEFAGVKSGVVEMRDDNVGVLSSNLLTMSYSNMTSITASSGEEIFIVEFVATKSGKISEMIEFTSKVTTSEAYLGETFEIRDIAVEMRGETEKVSSSALYQNEPNPFKGMTKVGFDLAKAGAATLTVHDVTGKVLLTKSLAGERGYNEVTLKAEELGISGVLFYTLESEDFKATKKMIIIE